MPYSVLSHEPSGWRIADILRNRSGDPSVRAICSIAFRSLESLVYSPPLLPQPRRRRVAPRSVDQHEPPDLHERTQLPRAQEPGLDANGQDRLKSTQDMRTTALVVGDSGDLKSGTHTVGVPSADGGRDAN